MNIINESLLNLDSINCENNLTLKTTLQHNNYHQDNDNTQSLSLNAMMPYNKKPTRFNVSNITITLSVVSFILIVSTIIIWQFLHQSSVNSMLPSSLSQQVHTSKSLIAAAIPTKTIKITEEDRDIKSVLLHKLSFDEKNISLRKTIASLYIEKKLFDAAIAVLEAGVAYANEGEYFALIAFAQQNKNMNQQAILSYQRALNYEPTESKWWLGLGIVLEKEKNIQEAKHAYLAALKPENLPFYIHKKTKHRVANM